MAEQTKLVAIEQEAYEALAAKINKLHKVFEKFGEELQELAEMYNEMPVAFEGDTEVDSED